MARIDSRNTRLEQCVEDSEDIKSKIEEIANNKDVSIVLGTDTPLSLLTKIDNATVKTPSGNINITDLNSTDVSNYATAQVVDTNLISSNIITGKTILGINGSAVVPSGTLNITSNGTKDVTNYASASVNVQPNLQTKNETITQNGETTYTADTGYDGLGSIKITVNVSGGGTTDIEIALPSAFESITNIYYFQVTSDKILISGNANSYSNGIGLWEYTISTGNISQVYNSTYSYGQYAQIIGNSCLLGNGMSNSNSLVKYDITTGNVSEIAQTTCNSGFAVVNNNKCLWGDNAGYNYVYNESNDTVTQIGRYTARVDGISFGNNYIMASNSITGIYLFIDSSDSIIQLDSSGNWYRFGFVGNKCLIGGTPAGILLLDGSDNSISTLFSTGTYWGFVTVSSTIVLASAGWTVSGGVTGLYVYNDSDGTFSPTDITTGYGWGNSGSHISNNVCLLSSSSSNGILAYNITTGVATQPASSYNGWNIFRDVTNGVIISGTSSLSRVMKYFYSTNSITTLLNGSSGTRLSICLQVGTSNDYLLSASGNTYGVVLYNDTAGTASVIYAGGGRYNTLDFISGNEYYVYCSDKTTNPRKLLYNSSTKAIKLAGLTL